MSQISFGWDDTIRPQRSLAASPSEPANKRKRARESEPLFSSPRRMAVKRSRNNTKQTFTVPVRRRIEGLSHAQLFELVESLCEHNPEFHNQISRLAPPLSLENALTSLRQYLHRVQESMPFTSDNKPSDYAYLRVEPLLQEFFVALADYTVALLPPNEQSLHRSLEFLDHATELVHSVPEWETPANNFLKNRAYGELSTAWYQCLQTMVERNNLVRFDTEARLAYHAQVSGGRMVVQNTSEPVLSIAPIQSVVA